MNRRIAIPLLLLFLLSQSGKVWIVIGFNIHREVIAGELCVNPEVPMCSGSCFLTQQLQEAEDRQQQIPNRSKDKVETFLFSQIHAWLLSRIPPPRREKVSFPERTDLYSSSWTHRIFHPPKASFLS